MSSAAQHTGIIRHRGFMHSIVAGSVSTWIVLPFLGLLIAHGTLAVGAGLGHIGWILAVWRVWGSGKRIGWAAGFASHMVVDALNTKGVQWFWPIPVWMKSPIPNITVGTWPEHVFRWMIWLTLGIWHPVLGIIAAASSEGIYRLIKI
jgi:inner membrane protein